MAKKEERFEVIFKDGSMLKDEGIRQILVDKETGVNYLCWNSGLGASITPLLDSEGKVIVTKQISVDISLILGNLITVIVDYQIPHKPLKILSL